jgi:RNA polymerase sigma-70 factor, ECF subfamily
VGFWPFNALSSLRIHPAGTRPLTPPTRITEDVDVVERARAGDAEAREQLVRLYLADVFHVTTRILGDRDLAQDATQDAFVNALNGLARFRGDASFRTWLLRIAVNAARSVGRRNGRRREVSLVLAEHEPSGGPDPARRAETAVEVDRVQQMLARLPTKQRLAVALRVQDGLSYAEIAQTLACSEGAARVNYHLGVKRLRELLR